MTLKKPESEGLIFLRQRRMTDHIREHYRGESPFTFPFLAVRNPVSRALLGSQSLAPSVLESPGESI